MKFVATEKSVIKNFFSSLSFVAIFASGIRDPGWVKIRIRDKHPGSATLLTWQSDQRALDRGDNEQAKGMRFQPFQLPLLLSRDQKRGCLRLTRGNSPNDVDSGLDFLLKGGG